MKIKVFHISKMKGVSGSENHLLALLSGLDKERFDVHLCILVETQHIPLLQEYKSKLERTGVTVFFLVIRKYFNVSVFGKLRHYIRQQKFQIVHTHLIHADLYGTLAAKLAGVRAIVSSRHNDDKFRRHSALIFLNRVLAKWQTNVLVISDWIGTFLQEVEGIPAEKIVRIHYGLEADSISAQADAQYVRLQLDIPDNVPLIGTIGRLTEQKGQEYLLQAIGQLNTEFPGLRVVLIGEGELLSQFQTLIQELGIAENIIFTGYRKDALKLLSGFDFFVFPSVWEGFGLVLLEAMAFKKAVVASRVSAIPESVQDEETGLLVPPKEVDTLAVALRRLLKHPEIAEKMGQAGYQRLNEEFSVHKMVAATADLYEGVVG